MDWPPEMAAGFVLAAIVSDDAALAEAARGLSEALRRELVAKLPEASQRRAALPGLLARVARPLCAPGELPARMRALVAAHLPRAEARAWLTGAPLPRAGFRPDAGLRQWARKAAEHPHHA